MTQNIVWSVVAFGAVLRRKQANQARFDAIRARIQSRLIKFATPTELIEITKIARDNAKLRDQLAQIVNTLEEDRYIRD